MNEEEVDSTATESGVAKPFGFNEAKEVSEDYTPEGYADRESFLKEMRERYEADVTADKQNRDDVTEDKRFAAGEQWDTAVLQQRAGLPCLTINSIPQFTAQLVGDWRQNRAGVKVVPTENGDVDLASVRSDLVRSIEYKSRASRVYDSAFESMVIAGDGAYQISVEYASDDVFDQDIVIKPIDDCLSVVWDRTSIDPTGRDAGHVFVDEIYPKREFQEIWGDIDSSTLSDRTYQDLQAGGWIDTQTVKVTAYWRMIERQRMLCLFENGSIHALDDDTDLDELIEKFGNPVRTRIAPCKYAQMHLVTGFDILAGPFEYKLNRVPIIRMSGRVVNVAGRRIRHGLVRFMKDPVRLRNFWRSVAAEQLGYAPKAQWIAPESAVEGREEEFRKAHLSRDPLLVYNDGEGKPERVEPPKIEAALLNEANVNTQDMKDVSGIHDASLGIKSNETSGRAIMARQREGDVASLTYYDNANAAVLEGGDVINQLISQIYDSTRTVRIIGEDEQAKLIRINDPMDPSSPDLSVGGYDVAITTGASYTTRRVEAADAMMQAVQVWPQLIQVAGDIIAKAQDWPGAQELSERLRKTIPPELLAGEKDEAGNPINPAAAGPQIPPEIEQAIMEGKAELESLKADKSIEERKLQIDYMNAETQRIKVLNEANYKNRESREKAQENLQRSAGNSAPK